ncbi:sigma-70 family RNA polymerase sigma factor [Geomicrobium sp. JCM 19038]|uniref:sigma-70 family RNA polymerase sigma factor n=1 Tax=Geomicrobium sp. JCM 19038 TaxID=1460635 RepID=UPI00045F4DAA|nr:sigma-70 family RNA polymerase sigma factor [Geomicrobium sp. JCM 19038]GAK08891.1 RNA polymerase sigma-70 factor [Geomicrobium sp. JCM 19038]
MNDLKKAKKGDEAALARVLLHEYDFVFHYLLKLTLHPSMAEDLTQDTMVKAIERFAQYNAKKAKLSTWLIQIGTNLWRDELRKEKRKQQYQSLQQLEWEMRHEPTTEWIAVIAELEKLKPEERIPVILKHYYGYGYDEIASIIGAPSGTVKSRLHSGMNRLRKELTHE